MVRIAVPMMCLHIYFLKKVGQVQELFSQIEFTSVVGIVTLQIPNAQLRNSSNVFHKQLVMSSSYFLIVPNDSISAAQGYYEAELNCLYQIHLPYLPFSIFSLNLSLLYW
jgi:hypothetical protein